MTLEMGLELLKKRKFSKSLKIFEKLLLVNSENPDLFFCLGNAYFELNEPQKSIFYYEKSKKIMPNSPQILHNLAVVYQSLGNISEAKKNYLKLLEINPNNIQAYFGLFNLNIKNINEELYKKLRSLSEKKEVSLKEKSFINFIFSKLEKEREKIDEEIKYLDIAHNQSINSKIKYNSNTLFYYKDILSKFFKKKKFHNSTNKFKNFSESNPVFIIGLPRSGSTLIESLISQSSNHIKSYGEFHAIDSSIRNQIGPIIFSQNFNINEFEFVINLENLQNSLLETYKELKNEQFIDKSLENFFYIDVILKLFPNAKFIHTFRNQYDAIIGIHQSMMPDLSWTHNLKHIIQYIHNYEKIITFYKNKFPKSILNVQLEKLTINPNIESEKIFKFLDIEWDENYLNFYRDKNLFSKTSSFMQIRNKIQLYNKSKYYPYYFLINNLNN